LSFPGRSFWLFPLLLLSLLIGCSRSAAPVVAAAPVEATTPFPVPIIELRGSGADIGASHGTQLGEPIRNLFHTYLAQYFTSDMQRNLAFAAAGAFESRISPQHLAEISALAAQAHIQPREALLAQCFLDLSAMTACSSITLPASASPDGIARFGRNLDFPSFNVADK